MHPPNPLLRLDAVGVRIAAGRELLSDVSLTLAAGELALVAGSRGSGKSLLARIAAGDRAPDRGRIRHFGQDAYATRGSELPLLKSRIGWCHDCPALLPGLTPVENVALPLRLSGVSARESAADAAELLAWLGDDGADWLRVGVARALIARPALVILDEPLREKGGLSLPRLAALVGQMRQGGSAFLVTTDDLARCRSLNASRCYVQSDGRLIGQ